MLRAVVDGMEAPQKGDFVRPAMAPIETNLADYQPGEDALPQRPGCDSSLHAVWDDRDRKSTRLNSSHLGISYAVFCLKKKRLNISNEDRLCTFLLRGLFVHWVAGQ